METEIHLISKERNLFKGLNAFTVWFTGLSGAGKSTLANLLNQEFCREGILSYVLDGDKLRRGLNSDLDFSIEGRKENIRRAAEVCKMMMEAGVIVIAALITPIEKEREWVKQALGMDFFLVHIDCPLEICERRYPKGLYKRSREGKISNFTGVDSPYEAPANPHLTVNTYLESPSACMRKLWLALDSHFV